MLRWSWFVPVLVLCVMGSAASLHAGDVVRPHGQALLFGIRDIGSLEGFQGGSIAYQRFVGENVAWRVGLGLELSYDAGEIEEGHWGGSYEGYGEDETEGWSHRVSLVTQWLVFRGDRVSVFYGGGPYLSYRTYRDEGGYLHGDAWADTWEDSDTYTVGFQGTIGTQWAAADWFALHAEYQVLGAYEHTSSEYYRLIDDEDPEAHGKKTESDRFLVDSLGVLFGISVYF
ncbi:MAG: hypothetical protein GF405_03250 [Candidatus Eisenbacteria bacterium]|nr:hypothetical protein [Candidatus Eisenbacteria bacterium]